MKPDMFTRKTTLLSALLSAVCLAGADAVGQTGRYLAVFADGRRVEGETVTGWHEYPARPKLDETDLTDPRRPLRWLRDRTLKAWQYDESCGGYVEFVGGDRLIGRVVGADRGSPDDAFPGATLLSVHVFGGPDQGRLPRRDGVRIFATDVRRVVWGHQPRRAFRPMTLFDRDGRQLRFLSMRWTPAGLRLLLDNDARLVRYSDVAELHLRSGDPWQAYYRELAVLCPDPSANLVRLATTTGMILTASTDRMRAVAQGSRKSPSSWYHVIQPAWAADAIWVPFDTIRTRWRFPPHEVPLTRLRPDLVVQKALTGYAWPWRRNRGAAGGELISGGQAAGWGLGTHAPCELTFTLPPLAKSFQARVGLDAAAGSGGCARAMVYLDAVQGKPIYRSKVLVGSAAAVDTGELKLPASPGGRKLILVADAAHRDRPPGADPYDIRDMLDWAEPVVHLDRGALRAEVARRIPGVVPALRGWQASVQGGAAPVRSTWDQSNRANPRFVPVVATGGKRMTLSIRRRIAPQGPSWLKLHVRQAGKGVAVGCIDVRVNGRTLARVPVHLAGSDLPYLVPLDAYRGKQVDLQVVYTPDSPDEGIQWRQVAVVDRKTAVDWRPLHTADAVSWNGAGLKVLPDGSILATGGAQRVSRIVDNYVIRAVTDLPRVTAIRLEAMPDSSLPGGGPGRFGGFLLTQFRLATLPARRTPIRGRYVRVEMPQPQRSLGLAEVEVFAPPPEEPVLLEKLSAPRPPSELVSRRHKTQDVVALLKTPPARRSPTQRIVLRAYLDAIARNIARKCATAQSGTTAAFKSDFAVDGDVRSGYTQTDVQDNPWWQVDLGAEREIDRIVVWNRVEVDLASNLRNFDVVVLDAARREVWRRRDVADPPVPAVEVFRSDAREVAVVWAWQAPLGSHAPTVTGALDSMRAGWTVQSRLGQPHAAVFILEKPVDARPTGLRIDLKHAEERWYRTLGRFRLLATADEPPGWAEPTGIVVPPATPPPPKLTAGDPQTSPRCLFEDDGHFEPVDPAAGPKATLVSDDKHAGARAVRVASGGCVRLRFARPVPIRVRPGEGEYRYIRFALRKYGGGQVWMGLEHLTSEDRPCRYEAGPAAPGAARARGVWPLELGQEWIVVDQDVFDDFGRLDLTGLTISCHGGGHAVLDHIYVARTPGDFQRLPPAASPAETNEKARLVLARPVLKQGLPAVVSLDADGQPGTGVIVGEGGWVLTAGHLIAGVGAKIKVRTHDGRVLAARAAGIDRTMDVGLVKITAKGKWPGLKIADAARFRPNCMYVGFSFDPSHEQGKTPRGYVTLMAGEGRRTSRMAVKLPGAAVGGPLLDSQARVVGVHNDSAGPGDLQFTRAHDAAAENWDRLTRGEVWGSWMPDVGPGMGIQASRSKEGCRIRRVQDGSAAAAAGLRAGDFLLKLDGQGVQDRADIARIVAVKNPGEQVVAVVRRDTKTFECKVRLTRHGK